MKVYNISVARKSDKKHIFADIGRKSPILWRLDNSSPTFSPLKKLAYVFSSV